MADDAGSVATNGSATRHSDSIIALSEWLETAPGRYVLAWEQAQFDALVADIFGFNAVQIGLLELPALRSSRMPFVFAAGEPSGDVARNAACDAICGETRGETRDEVRDDVRDDSREVAAGRLQPQVHIRFEELPFASQSIDLLVLPHALEFADDPHHVLREVERVLMPEGQVVISGFNPISLWGLRQVLGRSFNASFLPREGQFLALPRLKDWLKLLGFDVNRGHFGCYRPPFNAERWQSRFGFMERAGERWWSYCGAIYMVHAVKRVHGLRLVGPAWKDRIRVAAPVLQPAVRTREPSAVVAAAPGRDTVASTSELHADA